jgi:hypothetical protein
LTDEKEDEDERRLEVVGTEKLDDRWEERRVEAAMTETQGLVVESG